MGLDIEVCRKTKKQNYKTVAYWRNRHDVLQALYTATNTVHDNDSDDYDVITYEQVIKFQTLLRRLMEDGADESYRFVSDMEEVAKMLVTMQKHKMKYLFISASY